MNNPRGAGEAPWAWSSRHLDLIRDGVSPAELRTRGRRAVWRALLSTAESAQSRGIGFAEWRGLLQERRSQLGTQVFYAQRGAKPRSPREVEKDLAKAWATAEAWLATQPPAWSDTAREEELSTRIELARTVAEHPDAPLGDSERAVLLAVAEEHQRRGMLRVTIPKRRLAELTRPMGAAEWAARAAMDSLAARALVDIVSRGRSGNPTTGVRGRAAIYALQRAPLERMAAKAEQAAQQRAILAELACLDEAICSNEGDVRMTARPQLRLIEGGAA